MTKYFSIDSKLFLNISDAATLQAYIESLLKERYTLFNEDEHQSFSNFLNNLTIDFDMYVNIYLLKIREFDILIPTEEKIISIEVKNYSSSDEDKDKNADSFENLKECTKDKIIEQIKWQEKLLKQIMKDSSICIFLYIDNQNKYYLWNNGTLINKDIKEIEKEISSIKEKKILDLNKISSRAIFNNLTIENIKNDKFVLSDQQNSVLDKIEKWIDSTEMETIKLKGDAGSGKTLVLFKVYSDLKSKGKNVGYFIPNYNEKFKSEDGLLEFKNINSLDLNDKFDVVIVDEAQRLRQEQIDKIREILTNENGAFVYSIDEKQKLRTDEGNYTIENTHEVEIKGFLRGDDQILKLANLFFIENERERGYIEGIQKELKEEISSAISKDVLSLEVFDENARKNKTFITHIPSKYKRYYMERLENEGVIVKGINKFQGCDIDIVYVYIEEKSEFTNDWFYITTNMKIYGASESLYTILTRARYKIIFVFENKEILNAFINWYTNLI